MAGRHPQHVQRTRVSMYCTISYQSRFGWVTGERTKYNCLSLPAVFAPCYTFNSPHRNHRAFALENNKDVNKDADETAETSSRHGAHANFFLSATQPNFFQGFLFLIFFIKKMKATCCLLARTRPHVNPLARRYQVIQHFRRTALLRPRVVSNLTWCCQCYAADAAPLLTYYIKIKHFIISSTCCVATRYQGQTRPLLTGARCLRGQHNHF